MTPCELNPASVPAGSTTLTFMPVVFSKEPMACSSGPAGISNRFRGKVGGAAPSTAGSAISDARAGLPALKAAYVAYKFREQANCDAENAICTFALHSSCESSSSSSSFKSIGVTLPPLCMPLRSLAFARERWKLLAIRIAEGGPPMRRARPVPIMRTSLQPTGRQSPGSLRSRPRDKPAGPSSSKPSNCSNNCD